MHSLTHSLIPGAQLCLVGRQAGLWLSPLTRTFIFTSSTEDLSQEAGAQLLSGSTGRQEAHQPCSDGNVDSPSPRGHSSSHSSKGRGRQAKRVSGQALLQGCHPTVLPSNARPGRKPLPQARPSRNCCCFVWVWFPVSVLRCRDTTSSFHMYLTQGTMQGLVHASPQTLHPVTVWAPAHSLFLGRQRELPSTPRPAKGSHCCWGFFGFAFNSSD